MDDDLRKRILARRWFYAFELPTGERTMSYLPPEVVPIHDTRAAMLAAFLDRVPAADWPALRALDLACHEGYFAFQLARRGCREVVGLDVRSENVDSAELMRRALGLSNVRFRTADVLAIDPTDEGAYDLTLLFGILYHVPDVVGLLRRARGLTRRACLVETQVAPELPDSIEWGARDFQQPVHGALAVVDETAELEAGNREASVSRISLVPSLRALRYLLRAVGFDAVEVLVPPADAYEQFARGQRVMVAATVAARSDGLGTAGTA